jgi:hypothetical protein
VTIATQAQRNTVLPSAPNWSAIRRGWADRVGTVRRSMAAARAYEQAPSDAARRQVMEQFLRSLS